MRNAKNFDAVALKRQIQQRLDEEFATVSPEKAREAQRLRVEQDPALGPFLKLVRTIVGRPIRSG